MKILIIHDRVVPGAPADQRDVLDQVEAVTGALNTLGHDVSSQWCDLDLGRVRKIVDQQHPDCVFNLVESLAEQGRLIAVVPSLLDGMGVPYTGASAEALYLSSNKVLGKNWLRAAGLRVVPTIGIHPIPHPMLHDDNWEKEVGKEAESRFLVKSVWEHASLGIEEEHLVPISPPSKEELAIRAEALGGACLVEPFVDGREFNLSLIEGRAGEPHLLPPAEIDFRDFDQNQPHIVGYRAKWDQDSFEYHHTPRRFTFPEEDGPLIHELGTMAKLAWTAFGLRGYARVDFRVDRRGFPFILEVNANPCLSPDSGFVASAKQDGKTFEELIEEILRSACFWIQSTPVVRMLPVEGQETAGQKKREHRGSHLGELDDGLVFRDITEEDRSRILFLANRSKMFRADELSVVQELVCERLDKGEESGYLFLIAERSGEPVGFACYGPIACTLSAFDLYWLVVEPRCQGRGLGTHLLKVVEQRIKEIGGTALYAETSGSAAYRATRSFYEGYGFEKASVMESFYAPDDDKVTYRKILS